MYEQLERVPASHANEERNRLPPQTCVSPVTMARRVSFLMETSFGMNKPEPRAASTLGCRSPCLRNKAQEGQRQNALTCLPQPYAVHCCHQSKPCYSLQCRSFDFPRKAVVGAPSRIDQRKQPGKGEHLSPTRSSQLWTIRARRFLPPPGLAIRFCCAARAARLGVGVVNLKFWPPKTYKRL